MAHVRVHPAVELMTLRKFGSRLQADPERGRCPALESTSGPLGEGLAQGIGMASPPNSTASRGASSSSRRTPSISAGLHWEAVMYRGQVELDNLICIVDRNFIQIDGRPES